MTGILGVLLSVVIMPLFSLPAAAGIADISDAVSGLRQALTDGSGAAVKLLSVENGYFANVKMTRRSKATSHAKRSTACI